jgi:inositol phosphorylceramide mannosyltransferase catalytic subunit
MEIPRTIHQIWYQGADQLPLKYHDFQHSWQEHHPTWTYQLWDQTLIEQLLNNEYPDLHAFFHSLPLMIQQIDVAKYLILKKYGGIYVDMDMKCVQCLESLFQQHPDVTFCVPELRLDSSPHPKAKHQFSAPLWILTLGRYARPPFYNNSMIASTRNHPLWDNILSEVQHSIDAWKSYQPYLPSCVKEIYINNTTGPAMLTKIIRQQEEKSNQYSIVETMSKYSAVNNDHILKCPWYQFEPCDKYHHHNCDTSRAYAIHHCDNSWMSSPMKFIVYTYYNPSLILILFFVLAFILIVLIMKCYY